MNSESQDARPVSDAEKAQAKERFFTSAQRVSSRVDSKMKADFGRASFVEDVVGEERIPMFLVSFPDDSALSGFHFAFTVEHLLKAEEEEIAAGLLEDIDRQLEERAATLPWWKRILRR